MWYNIRMHKLIFIDESGDVDKGSKYFNLCMVIFDDYLEAEKTAVKLKELRRERFQDDGIEFHFTKDSMATKRKFFASTLKHNFKVKSCVIDKDNFDTGKITYEKFLMLSLESFIAELDNGKLHIDGTGSKMYRRNIITGINKLAKKNKVKIYKIDFYDSKKNILIQMADMYAGLIRRKYQKNNEENEAMFLKVKDRVQIILAWSLSGCESHRLYYVMNHPVGIIPWITQ